MYLNAVIMEITLRDRTLHLIIHYMIILSTLLSFLS